MKLLDFGFALIEKFTPMSTTDRQELRNDAATDYIKIKTEILNDKKELIVDKKSLTLKQKVIYWSEMWQVRMVLALAFIWIVPLIQNWMNPQPVEDEDDDV